MRQLLVCSMFDVKVGTFMSPFLAPALGAASRSFQDLLGDAQQPFGRHPEDFRLFQLATFDDETGTFANLPSPVLVVDGAQFNVKPLREVSHG